MQFVLTPVHEHRCPACGTAFDFKRILDHRLRQIALDENGAGTPEHLHVVVGCSDCPEVTTLTFPFKSPPLTQLLKEFHRDEN